MSDVFTKAKHSEVMSRIRSRGNRDTELALAALFRRHGITGWRRQRVLSVRSSRREEAQTQRSEVRSQKKIRASSRRLLRVRPDFVFPKRRLAVFVDGCFWHGCPLHSPPARWLRKSAMPLTPESHKDAGARRTGKRFWREKLAANQARDRKVNLTLRAAGWRVLRIWEHELPKRGMRRENL